MTFLIEKTFTIEGLNFNFSFLLIYLFVIHYFFPKVEQKKIEPSELLPILFFIIVGLLEDLFQGILGPAVISKSITGYLLILLIKQLFFHWTELFKAIIICIFTIIDEIIYSLIMIYFFNISLDYFSLLKLSFIKGLSNIPFGLILSWRKP
ncbi:MAG: hypothetical protein RMI30_02840 [Thermodesulfovibrio sp.]|nr:hypothetical protein [Thermodesulfovibrio sp.]MDW7998372.1 hypothetical protein [Thermodesulfovibrio sp.]